MSFFEKVYDVVKQVPRGKVITYGTVARLCGNPRSSRIVGFALHANPNPDEIPCHRVVNRFGKLSGSFAFGGMEIQKQLLEGEGVVVDDEYCVDLQIYHV